MHNAYLFGYKKSRIFQSGFNYKSYSLNTILLWVR